MARGVILDRDGTLIDFHRDADLGLVTPAFHPSQVRLLPGVLGGLELLRDAGFVLSIASNQPDAAKGRVGVEAIAATNAALVQRLSEHGIAIARTEICLHHPDRHDGGEDSLCGPCSCRKPAPGMLDAIAEGLALDRSQSWMVGDTAADLGAARAAGLRCGLLIQTERCELCPLRGAPLTGLQADLMAPRLDDLARALLEAG